MLLLIIIMKHTHLSFPLQSQQVLLALIFRFLELLEIKPCLPILASSFGDILSLKFCYLN